MRAPPGRFTALQRMLHWLMAAAILAMLFIGVAMVSTPQPRYSTLVSIHKPLGISILLLVLLRLGLRFWRGAPPLPADLPSPQVAAAKASHVLLYALMFAMPLIGWSMISAGGYPIVLYGPIHLPQIMPHNDALHALLWDAHRLAFLFFTTILVHLAAALFHGLVRQDGVFSSMAPIKTNTRGRPIRTGHARPSGRPVNSVPSGPHEPIGRSPARVSPVVDVVARSLEGIIPRAVCKPLKARRMVG